MWKALWGTSIRMQEDDKNTKTAKEKIGQEIRDKRSNTWLISVLERKNKENEVEGIIK